ncbi:MAG: hypothetical protein ACLFOY_10880 [Desulfatibacillaceae bacterium]
MKRVREAVSEIKKVARKDPVLGAEGAVLFLEKVAPAIEHVDSSSGAIGTAVYKAIESLAPIIANAPASDEQRDKWLDRLWEAFMAEGIGYLDNLGGHWGEMCATPQHASRWADDFIGIVRESFSSHEVFRYFKGTTACLSALYHAGRYQELLDLLELPKRRSWPDHIWGVKALVAMGKKAVALRYAEQCSDGFHCRGGIAGKCEEILLSSGLAEEAYQRYAIAANQKMTYLATFRAIAKKYPAKNPEEILADLVASTPGEEGKWFAAAKSAGLLDEALSLAKAPRCDPKTVIRAARDMEESHPEFSMEFGLAALLGIANGYGYEIDNLDVLRAYGHALSAAGKLGRKEEVMERIRAIAEGGHSSSGFVKKVLGIRLDW